MERRFIHKYVVAQFLPSCKREFILKSGQSVCCDVGHRGDVEMDAAGKLEVTLGSHKEKGFQ